MRHWKIMWWCRTAVKKIRYTPDREAVFEELRQHLDDRSDDFGEKGLDKEEAVEKTLEVMGSPDELSVILGQIHRPYWGYAYSVTKLLSKIFVIAFLVLLVISIAQSLLNQEYTQPNYSNYNPYTDTESESASRIGLWEQSDSFSYGGYTYSLEKCALWHPEDIDKDVLYTRIRITNYLPWASTPAPRTQLEAADNLGNHYVNTRYNYARQPHRLHGGRLIHTAPFVWILELSIYSPGFDGVEWIEIYNRDGHDLVLRIDLTGGDTQ